MSLTLTPRWPPSSPSYCPFLEALRLGFADMKRENPNLFNQFTGIGGLYNCRSVRGGSSPSSHAYGMAIDFAIRGYTDVRGDGCSVKDLLTAIPFFNQRGIKCGVNYPTEDTHHFEPSKKLANWWIANGVNSQPPRGAFTGGAVVPPPTPPVGNVVCKYTGIDGSCRTQSGCGAHWRWTPSSSGATGACIGVGRGGDVVGVTRSDVLIFASFSPRSSSQAARVNPAMFAAARTVLARTMA